jgi:hypothetical protein
MTDQCIWGLLAEFDSPEALIRAARAVDENGYVCFDAFSPSPLEELSEVVRLRRPWLPRIVLIAGLSGGGSGFLLQWWISAVAYPLDVGGRPLLSWPAFIPVTFELTILCAAFGAVVGMLMLNGLPAPYHPVFNVPQFRSATVNGFFLAIESRDKQFRPDETLRFLESLNPLEINTIAP